MPSRPRCPLACLQDADGFKEVAQAVLAAHDSGELATALQSGHDGYKVGGWVGG